MHYLDNAATTPPLPDVMRAMDEARREHWGNPSSLYRLGGDAGKQLEAARAALAALLGAKPPVPPPSRDRQVYFTACGTEANNIAVQGAIWARAAWGKRVVATGYEHPAVREALTLAAGRTGMETIWVPPGADGNVPIEDIVAQVDAKTALVCAMQVNNETGAVLDVAALAAAVKQKNSRCFVHVDGVQAFGRLPLALAATQIDGYAVSAHKLHGPRGVGALYLKSPTSVQPLLGGGGQEGGLRPGTEDVPGAVGFACAARLACENRERDAKTVAALRARLLDGLRALEGRGVVLHTPPGGYAGIVMFSLPRGLRSQVMLNYLDLEHSVCVSSGSACSGGAASHTLAAMGVPPPLVDTAIRASFGGGNTEKDIDALLRGLQAGIDTLARA